MDPIEERVIEILSVIFDEHEGTIHPGLTKQDIEQWDSLHSAQILMAVEKEFDKFLTYEEISSIHSVMDIIRLVG
ncbi:acyl carrier protein [Paenibacillus sp. HN-1]|uniref:acyl carrier protein n=1 Tax=Paenibacillus TaxID=44249 RepID=UPI001CA7F5CC|nr:MULTISPECIES: acyl carrier protein [Paenibacillus]MBY9080758.1 acyl carrier protein [Paenibacillus sp. CGMCC 1.18879]MBY9085250.1 acyl carrier protein [Paenibacillus sinensis]